MAHTLVNPDGLHDPMPFGLAMPAILFEVEAVAARP